MRLIRLTLKNFRQHVDNELGFRPGLTAIIGPNGSGKTTILEAITWAIYGSAALRGTREALRFNRAPGRSQVKVELDFELRGERYRVIRSLRDAELYRAEREDPIASGLTEVTRQLTRRLGMTHQEFFNTYFTKQRELQFLAAMGPTERARFLSQVLGYERLRTAQALVREERSVLKGKVEELRLSLGDLEEIKRRRREAQARLKDASSVLSEAEHRHAEAEGRLAELEPVWEQLKSARERDRQLAEELRVAQTRLDRVLKERREAEAELAVLDRVAVKLEELRRRAQPLEGLRQEEERLRVLSEVESRRASLLTQLGEQRARVDALAGRVAEQEAKAERFDELKKSLAGQDEECDRLEGRRENALSQWQREAQDVEARLRILKGQAEELKTQLEQLESAGPDGVCPTCKRSLGDEYDPVLELVRGQYEEVVQDGVWHRKRLEQLETEPEGVVSAKAELARARAERERIRTELAAAEAARVQAAALRSELDGEEARARSLAGEIAALPAGYDAARHAEVRGELERLRELERKITQLETRLERRARLRSARAEAEEEERQVRAQMAELQAKRAELGFSEERYGEVGVRFDAARGELDAARLELERVRAEVDAARQAAEAARREEKEQRKISRAVREREREHRLHNDLDEALGGLRHELNERVRPELSEIASVFLTELTDGRYNQIEINRDYEVIVLDDGEEKPVISGGEQDLANLVLRLAISQMIADRAGQALSLLIFDEVFGGLDEQRREGVVRLLQRLQDRFEQVILITHIESIREGMDQVTRVTYDESTGSSLVQDESPGAAGGVPEPESLAALASD